MLIELVDALRCPAPHSESHLVASVHERRGTHVWEGTLGCPVCRASYPVARGVAYFGVEPGAAVASGSSASANADDVDRALALLDLGEPGGFVLLQGAWTDLADALAAHCAARYVTLDTVAAAQSDLVSALRVAGPLPFGAGVFRAVAVDDVASDAVARVAASRARVVLPASRILPPELRRLVADERHVVAEREPPASAPVPLRRRAPFTG